MAQQLDACAKSTIHRASECHIIEFYIQGIGLLLGKDCRTTAHAEVTVQEALDMYEKHHRPWPTEHPQFVLQTLDGIDIAPSDKLKNYRNEAVFQVRNI